MQLLRGRVNDLKTTKIKMCSDLQKKDSLLEQLESISKENTQLSEIVKVRIILISCMYVMFS